MVDDDVANSRGCRRWCSFEQKTMRGGENSATVESIRRGIDDEEEEGDGSEKSFAASVRMKEVWI